MITACIGPLMWQVAVSMAATGCWGQPLLGEAVLDRVFAERESITSGVVHVYQVWDLGVGHRLIERDETAYFNNERCRFDIHWHSGFARLYESRGVPMPDPYAILIWDGQHILRAAGNLASTEYSLQSEDSSGLPLYSARHLGIPLVRAPEADLRRAYRNAKVRSISRDGDLYTVVLAADRMVGRGDGRVPVENSKITFTVDSSKGWSVTSYVIEEDAWGIHWTLKGKSVLALFGDVWYPSWHRHEQYRDGAFDWAREYQVLEAEFNQPLPADTFSWKATGIPRGSPIVSYVPDHGSLRWNGSEAVGWYPGPLKKPDKPTPRPDSNAIAP